MRRRGLARPIALRGCACELVCASVDGGREEGEREEGEREGRGGWSRERGREREGEEREEDGRREGCNLPTTIGLIVRLLSLILLHVVDRLYVPRVIPVVVEKLLLYRLQKRKKRKKK